MRLTCFQVCISVVHQRFLLYDANTLFGKKYDKQAMSVNSYLPCKPLKVAFSCQQMHGPSLCLEMNIGKSVAFKV